MEFNSHTNLKLKCTNNCIITPYSTFLLECIENENFEGKKICDFGCGTGVLGLNIRAKYNCNITGLDIINEAIQLSKENAKFNLLDNCHFCTVDDFISNPYYKPYSFKFDYIISNPASIPSNSLSVKNPFINGGINGNQMINNMIDLANSYLKKKGQVIFLHTSLASLHNTLLMLDKYGYKISIEKVKQLEFRKQYNDYIEYLELLKNQNENFFFDNNGKKFELIYLIRIIK